MKRWGIAWTFDPDVQLQKVISKKQKLTQKPMVFSVPRTQMTVYSVQALWSKILIWLKDIKVRITYDSHLIFVIWALESREIKLKCTRMSIKYSDKLEVF